MRALQINEKTGFLESSKGTSFDSVRKVRFLELAREAAENKMMPDMPAICKALDISTHTFYEHKRLDENFNKAYEEILDTCESTLVQTMYANGQRPSGYMDRITWLRAHRPGTWNPDYKVTITQDTSQLKGAIDTAATVIDGVIVEESKHLPVNCPSELPK